MRFVLALFALAASAQTSFRIEPLRPVDELRAEALRATPPAENRQLRPPDLVDLATLRADFHFDIRYATANNFMGSAMYSETRAFLQRPAADALLRAAASLRTQGFGLLIYDAYRPWYVTKMFWDATPARLHTFVANPAKGSKHNRGCAVDLGLYDLRTNEPISMPSGYDEMTLRAHPGYGGGAALERAHRDALRKAMEAEGFTVDRGEWWHYDYKAWRQYPILNIPFERVGSGG